MHKIKMVEKDMSKKSLPTHFPATKFPWAAANITSLFSILFIYFSFIYQWLRLCAFTTVGPGSVPGLGTKMLQVCGTAKKKLLPHLHSALLGIYKYATKNFSI